MGNAILTSGITSDFTMSTFKENHIDIATKTMVKEVKEKVIIAQNEKKEIVEYPYGLLVWSVSLALTFLHRSPRLT